MRPRRGNTGSPEALPQRPQIFFPEVWQRGRSPAACSNPWRGFSLTTHPAVCITTSVLSPALPDGAFSFKELAICHSRVIRHSERFAANLRFPSTSAPPCFFCPPSHKT
jgi:hypothetical protein